MTDNQLLQKLLDIQIYEDLFAIPFVLWKGLPTNKNSVIIACG